MIIEGLFTAVYTVFELIFFIRIPPLPDTVHSYVDIAFDYIVAGAGVLANYVHLDYLMSLFAILITVDIVIAGYHLVMWIIRKAPISSE